MKIINEKGKLFGFINIIDLSIIVLILLVATVLLVKTVGKDVVTETNKTQDLIVTYRAAVRNDEQLKAIKEGDQLISILNPEEAYVKSVTYKDLILSNTTAEGKQVNAIDPTRKELVAKFSMQTPAGNGIIKLGSQDIAVGKTFILKTRTIELTGTIEAIEIK